MDKGKRGQIMDVFLLENSRITTNQKEKSMNCNKMVLLHYSQLNMIKMKKNQRKKKLAEDIKTYEYFF